MSPKSKDQKITDEPGAEERFQRGIQRALETPPKRHKAIKSGKGRTTEKPKKEPQGS